MAKLRRRRNPAAKGRAARRTRDNTLANRPGRPGPLPMGSKDSSDRTLKKYGLDAFHPCHLPLPRAIGKYLVVRTVAAFKASDYLTLFGPSITRSADKTQWNNAVALAFATDLRIINAATTSRYTGPNPTVFELAQVVPAAFTVQVMNDTALQTAAGVFYMGKCTSGIEVPDISDNRTAKELAESLISFKPPRILTGSKLALRAVKADAVPVDMAEMAEFCSLAVQADIINLNWPGNHNGFAAFAPIYLVNPGNHELQFMVGTEWRLRFDPTNPAGSAATNHGVKSDNFWNDVIQGIEKLGHGVVDAIEWVEGWV